MSIRSIAALPLFLALGSLDAARAQCGVWAPGFNWTQNGFDEFVNALAVFDDGNGPALYAGGGFSFSGTTTLAGIGRWNGASWSPLSTGMGGNDPTVWSFAVWDDGGGKALYVGGGFTLAGGVPANHVARWDGSTWTPLGQGMDFSVYALASFDDGTGPALYAGGNFSHAGGTPANGIAKWNGTTWSPLGGGVTGSSGVVSALTVFDDGSGPALYVGGAFDFAGGLAAHGIAKWNGSTWSPLGSGVNGIVLALTAFDAGGSAALYVAGNFNDAGGGTGARNIAKWNGSAWSALGSGLQGSFAASVAGFDDGTGPQLYAGGEFTDAGGVQAISIARWNGTAWSDVNYGLYENFGLPPFVSALAVFDDLTVDGPHLFAGGEFFRAGPPSPPNASANIAKLLGCENPGLSLCFGDGSSAACPCGNSGAQHRGCLNSVTTEGASLAATGRTSPDTIVLQAFGETPSALSIFLQGTITISPAAFGDGLRCTGGQLLRLYVKSADRGAVSAPGPGDLSISARSAALGSPIPPGHRRYYQVYYRDAASGFCSPPAGGTFNVTNGVRLNW